MERTARSRLPRAIVAFGFVSLFMGLSSRMIHGLLPVLVRWSVPEAEATFLAGAAFALPGGGFSLLSRQSKGA